MKSLKRSRLLLRIVLFLCALLAIAPHVSDQPVPDNLAVPFTENEFGLLLKLPPPRSGEFDRVVVLELGGTARP